MLHITLKGGDVREVEAENTTAEELCRDHCQWACSARPASVRIDGAVWPTCAPRLTTDCAGGIPHL